METINSMEVNVADVLRDSLKNGICNFSYKKKDGSIRKARGTLVLDLMPESATQFKNELPENARQERDDIVTYYDFDKLMWRSCKTENILEIEGVSIV